MTEFEMIPAFTAGVLINQYLYFSDNYINALARINMNSMEMEYICSFPDEEIETELLHGKALYFKKIVVFIPNQGKHIHFLNTESMQIKSVFIDKIMNSRYAINDCVIVGDTLWVFPGDGVNEIFTINLNSFEMEKHGSICSELYKEKGCKQLFYRIAFRDNAVYMVELASSNIIKFVLDEKKTIVIHSEVSNLESIFNVDGDMWLTTKNGIVISWNSNINQYQKYSIDGYFKHKGLLIFSCSGAVWCVCQVGGYLYRIDKDNKKIEIQNTIQLENTDSNRMGSIYSLYSIDNNKICFFPPYGMPIQIFVDEKIERPVIKMVNKEEYIKKREYAAKSLVKDRVLRENELISLESFINVIMSIDGE